MMTSSRVKATQAKAAKKQAAAAVSQAASARMNAETNRQESKSKRFANIGTGIRGIGSGFGNAMQGLSKGAEAIGTIAAVNDPSWYKSFPGFSEMVSRLPSSMGPGIGFDVARFVLNSSLPDTQPTVTSFKWRMTVGPQITTTVGSGLRNNPINMVGQYIMTEMRKRNSRSGTEYDPSDLIFIFYTLGSALVQIKRLKFIFKAANTFDQQHMQQFNALYVAKGFYPSDIANFRANIAKYRAELNYWITQLNYFPLLKDMALYKRWTLLESLCLLDFKSTKAQYYVFNCTHTFEYEDDETMVTSHSAASTFALALDNLKLTIGGLMNIDSLNVMFADIRGAFDDSAFYQESLMEMDEKLEFALSDEIFDQLHNIIMPCALTPTPDESTWALRQDPNGYVYQGSTTLARPSLAYDGSSTQITPSEACNDIFASYTSPKFLDFHHDDISLDDILVASRLTTRWLWDRGHSAFYPRYCGSEVVYQAVIIRIDYTSVYGIDSTYLSGYLSGTIANQMARQLTYATQFHCFPRYIVNNDHTNTKPFFLSDGTSNGVYHCVMYDVGHMVELSDDNLRDLHVAAFASELAQPFIVTKFVR